MANALPYQRTRLPDAVLLQIFRCRLTGPAVIPPPVTDERERLMAVCPRWETLIGSSPEFWARAVFLPVSSQIPGHLAGLAQTWLHRSQGVLVSINFDAAFETYNPRGTLTRTQQAVYGAGEFCIVDTIIIPCATRIISLKCVLATNATIRSFLTIRPGQFRTLHYIELTLVNQLEDYLSRFYTWEFPMFNVFQSLPFLQQVKFRILNGMHPYSLRLPWNQLTTLYLTATPMPPDILLHIIESTSPSLIDGRFHVKFTEQTKCTKSHKHTQRCRSPPDFPTVIAWRLRSLELILIDPSRDQRMFGALHLPALISLQVELEDVKKGWDLAVYMPLLASVHHLQHLSLALYASPLICPDPEAISRRPHRLISSAEMEDLFVAIRSVSALRLGPGLYINSPTLEKMARGQLLPFLEKLEMGSLSGGQVLRMVEQRNVQARYVDLHPGRAGDSPVYAGAHLRPISVLHLLVPRDELAVVAQEAKVVLNTTASCANVRIVVHGIEVRFFYFTK